MDGCSYASATGPQVDSVDDHVISFSAGLAGKARACGDWPWGGQWKTDIGDISGTVVGRFPFVTEPTNTSGRYNGFLKAQQPEISITFKTEHILGIDTDSVVGKMLVAIDRAKSSPITVFSPGASVTWQMLSQYDTSYRRDGNEYIDTNYLTSVNGAVSSERYLQFLQDLRSFSWSVQPQFVIDDKRTTFRGTASDPVLDVVYTARLKPKTEQPGAVWADIETEIDLIKSFKEKEDTVIVSPGQSLWQIAEENYGSGFYFNLLAKRNGIPAGSLDKLDVGKSLIVPPMFELAPVIGVYFAEPGDTLDALCTKWRANGEFQCLNEVASRNPKININRIFAGQANNLPEGIN